MQVYRNNGPTEPITDTETWCMSSSIRKSYSIQRCCGVYLMYTWSCSKEDLIKHKTEYEYFLQKTDKPYIKSVLEWMIKDLEILIAEAEWYTQPVRKICMTPVQRNTVACHFVSVSAIMHNHITEVDRYNNLICSKCRKIFVRNMNDRDI